MSLHDHELGVEKSKLENVEEAYQIGIPFFLVSDLIKQPDVNKLQVRY